MKLEMVEEIKETEKKVDAIKLSEREREKKEEKIHNFFKEHVFFDKYVPDKEC
jgi:cupin superfamily acireductone dioxygenase involved in methionine salvage